MSCVAEAWVADELTKVEGARHWGGVATEGSWRGRIGRVSVAEATEEGESGCIITCPEEGRTERSVKRWLP